MKDKTILKNNNIMTPKEQHINRIIKENNYKNYLELGFQDGSNFNKIECENKTSVDVNGKADFNDGDLDFFDKNDKEFDCILVDSEHTAEHVRKVIIESLKSLTKDGCIILHDTIPANSEMQEVPRKTKQFTGNVWRAVVGFIQEYPEIKVETYRSDWGLSVLYPEGKRVRKHFENKELTYEEFDKDKETLLNIID